jgi:hypothetical protein
MLITYLLFILCDANGAILFSSCRRLAMNCGTVMMQIVLADLPVTSRTRIGDRLATFLMRIVKYLPKTNIFSAIVRTIKNCPFNNFNNPVTYCKALLIGTLVHIM